MSTLVDLSGLGTEYLRVGPHRNRCYARDIVEYEIRDGTRVSSLRENTVLAVGYGLLPSNTATGQLYRVLTIAAEIDRETHCILDASITLITDTSSRWVTGHMVGNDLLAESNSATFAEQVETRFLGNSRKAIIHAYRDMTQRYQEHIAAGS